MTAAAAAVVAVASELLHRSDRSFAVSCTPDTVRVGHMRRITTAHLRQWKVSGPTADHIVLAVSELVTNGIQHGQEDIGLNVRYTPGEVRVEVTDGSPSPAQLTYAEDEDVSGRGLFLVAALARDWGVSDDGKTTWCTFPAPTGRR
ncbi:ATP-binding protein [Streptomyces lydicus]|uniref:ATP-binding protein n=1 Tax=Streptomyces lydicus TaxID=47763 RepID=UPI0037A18107